MTTAPTTPTPDLDAPPAPGPGPRLTAQLTSIRARAKWMLLGGAAARLIAVLSLGVLTLAVADYFLRTPAPFRIVLWVLGTGTLLWLARRWVVPGLRFRPSLTEIALRMERTPEARRAGLNGFLAAALDLSAPDAQTDSRATAEERSLRAGVLRTVDDRLSVMGHKPAVLSPDATRRRVWAALAALVPLALGMALTPTLTRTGLTRVLVPWASVDWPKRTAVADATGLRAHPLGAAIPLRAVLSHTDRRLGRTDVWVCYRLDDPDHDVPVQRLLLTGQAKITSTTVGDGEDTREVTGELYERLLEPAVLSSAAAPAPNAAALGRTFEYWFQTDDDRTLPNRIELVEPPAVVDAAATVTPPPYAARPAAQSTPGTPDLASGTRPVGPGRDERATVGPILVGSLIALDLKLNKPVPLPPDPAAVFGAGAMPADLTIEPAADPRGTPDAQAWTVRWTAADSVRLPVQLTDEFGITSVQDSAFQFNVVADRPATASVLDPPQDESVLATATIPVLGEGRDDVGVAWASLEARRASPTAGSAGAPAEPVGDPTELSRRSPAITDTAADTRQVRVTTTLDLRPLSLKPKDELWVTALAQDRYDLNGAPREPARSPVRRLRIIAESELVEQIRAELGGIRQSAMRLDQDQAEARRRVESNAAPADVRPTQEGLTQRIVPQGESVKRLADRTARNNLDDRALAGLLQDAQAALDQAAARSADAARALEHLERAAAEPAAAERDAVMKTQRQVRDQLGQLIAMLDRGQDGWTARRELQRLLEDQLALANQTKSLDQQTAGKALSDLTPAQRAQLEQAAQQQQDLARRAAQVIDDLGTRGEQLAKTDPAMAQSMKDASQRGQQSRVSETQQQAAEQVRQNQTNSAEQSQRQAAQDLQEMLDDLDNSDRHRDRALRRQLEEIIDAIDALIAQQEGELKSLAAAATEGSLRGLDAGMIALHAGTVSVSERARAGSRELADVADLLDGAAEAQTTAVTVLRSAAGTSTDADQAERLSLDRLHKAHDLAKKLDDEAQDRDQSRRRAELRKFYREALERQAALRAETEPFLALELDRRQRAGVRALGERQLKIRTDLAAIQEKTEDLRDAKLFLFAHQRLDRHTTNAAAPLREGAAPAAVGNDQLAAVKILRGIVEALKESKNQEFSESPNGDGNSGGGGNGGGPLIPPLAQLRLLRAMQQDAAELTRAFADHAPDDDAAPASLDELGQLQDQLTQQAEELVRKQNEPKTPDRQPPDGPLTPPPEPPVQPPENAPAGFGFSPPPAPPRPDPSKTSPPDAAPPPAPPDDPLPTLDDLLGLPGDANPDRKAPDQDPSRQELDRKLAPTEIAEEFAQTVDLMRRTTDRLGKARDAGLATQRMQEDIVRRLDQIIAAAEKNQQQQSSKSKSQKNDPQQQNQPQPQPSQNPKGENRGEVVSPPRQDGPLTPPKPAASSAWGSLPEHLRDALRQGLGDRFSSLYQSMTESYYRRLAEEPKPGTSR